MRLRRFLGRQTVPKGLRAARAATLHQIHGQIRLAQLGEQVGGHALPPLGARITLHVMVRTIVDLGAMVFVSDGRSRGAGAPPLTSGAERLINAGWALLLVTAQVGGDIWKGMRDRVLLHQEVVVST